ncbi:hypothetical protein GCM10010441_40760 [Kitasatospora paracochleata]
MLPLLSGADMFSKIICGAFQDWTPLPCVPPLIVILAVPALLITAAAAIRSSFGPFSDVADRAAGAEADDG